MALTYSSLVSSTIKHYKKGFVDNIIRDFILLAALGDKNLAPEVFKMRKPEGEGYAEGIKLIGGGEKIFMPLMYGRNSTVAAYTGYDTLDITPADPFTAAEYDWKSIAGSVNMDNERLDKNRDDAVKLFDLLKGMMDNLKVSMQESVNDMLLSPKAAGSKQPFGLMDIVKDDPTTNPAVANLGGIDASTYSWWRNQTQDLALAAFGTDQTGAGMKKLRALIRACTFGTVSPNLLLAGENAFESVELALINQARYQGEGVDKLVKAGYQAIMVKGIPMVMEKRVTTLRSDNSLSGDGIYALNTKYLKLWGMKHRWFEPSDVKQPTNQDTTVQHVITRCQLCTDNRRTQGVLLGIAAP